MEGPTLEQGEKCEEGAAERNYYVLTVIPPISPVPLGGRGRGIRNEGVKLGLGKRGGGEEGLFLTMQLYFN